MRSLWRSVCPHLTLAVAVAAGTVVLASPVSAATVSCGGTITSSVTLTADVGPCPGDGLHVRGDGLVLQLGGHRVIGSNRHAGTSVGITVHGSHRVTVSGGTVTGFDGGVAVLGGGQNTLSDLSVRDNVGRFSGDFCDGVFVFNSPGVRLQRSQIIHNGPCDGIGVFGGASIGDVIQGNLVSDQTVPRDPGVSQSPTASNLSTDFGINLGQGFDSWPSHVAVLGNVVSNNAGDGILACSQFGAPCVTIDDVISGNLVQHNGFYYGADTPAVQDGGDGIRLVDLDPSGVEISVPSRITVQGNRVTQNAANGIFVATEGNTIAGNQSVDNDQSRAFFDLDLADVSEFGSGCDANTWTGNQWGRYFNALPQFGPVSLTSFGSYDPECVSVNGTGPRPGAAAIFSQAASVSGTAAQSAPRAPISPPPPRRVPAIGA